MVAQLTDLSGVVQTLVADLSGVVVNTTKIVEVLPKLVISAWGLNLEKDKVQEQVLAAVHVLVARCVAETERPVVQIFVDSVVPAIVGALCALADEIQAVVAKKAEEVEKKVVEKIQTSALGRWFSGLCGKVVAAVSAPAAAPAAAPAVPEVVAAVVPAVPEVVAAAPAPEVVVSEVAVAAPAPAPVPEVVAAAEPESAPAPVEAVVA